MVAAEKVFALGLSTRTRFRKDSLSTTVKGWSSTAIHLTSEDKYSSCVYGYIKKKL
jgi:hypothetical protein